MSMNKKEKRVNNREYETQGLKYILLRIEEYLKEII